MRKLLLFLFLCLGICTAKAHAACGTIPFTFTNNVSTVDASTTNSNNTFLLGCATNVDHTQIGSSGIFASQIIPTTLAQAVFGGAFSYTFSNGLTVNGGNVTTSGSYVLPSTQSVLFGNANGDLQLWVPGSGVTAGGVQCTLLSIYVQGTGAQACFNTTGDEGIAHAFNAAATISTGGTPCINTNAICSGGGFTTAAGVLEATAGIGLELCVNGSCSPTNADPVVVQAAVQTTSNGITTSYTPPIYTASGTILPSTVHGVSGTCSFVAVNSCAVSLSGAAAFTSQTSYACGLTTTLGGGSGFMTVSLSGSSFNIVTNNGATITATLAYECIGS